MLGWCLYKLLNETVCFVEKRTGSFGGCLNLSFPHQEWLRFNRPREASGQVTNKDKASGQENYQGSSRCPLQDADCDQMDAVGFCCASGKSLSVFGSEKGHKLHIIEDAGGARSFRRVIWMLKRFKRFLGWRSEELNKANWPETSFKYAPPNRRSLKSRYKKNKSDITAALPLYWGLASRLWMCSEECENRQ